MKILQLGLPGDREHLDLELQAAVGRDAPRREALITVALMARDGDLQRVRERLWQDV